MAETYSNPKLDRMETRRLEILKSIKDTPRSVQGIIDALHTDGYAPLNYFTVRKDILDLVKLKKVEFTGRVHGEKCYQAYRDGDTIGLVAAWPRYYVSSFTNPSLRDVLTNLSKEKFLTGVVHSIVINSVLLQLPYHTRRPEHEVAKAQTELNVLRDQLKEANRELVKFVKLIEEIINNEETWNARYMTKLGIREDRFKNIGQLDEVRQALSSEFNEFVEKLTQDVTDRTKVYYENHTKET